MRSEEPLRLQIGSFGEQSEHARLRVGRQRRIARPAPQVSDREPLRYQLARHGCEREHLADPSVGGTGWIFHPVRRSRSRVRSPDSYVYRGGNAYELTKEHARELGGAPIVHRASDRDELERALAQQPVSLAIGHWEKERSAIVDAIAAHRPPLRHLFLG